MYLYEIRNHINDKVYVGITRNTIERRFTSHKFASKTQNSILYNAMRKYGVDKFYIIEICKYEFEKELLEAEKILVSHYRELGRSYNILDGGESYFNVVNVEEWKAKLKIARKGKTPALGMKHTEATKEKLRKITSDRYIDNTKFDNNEVVKYSFKEANKLFGISKTHYYRLYKKLVKSNELN